MDAVRRKQTDTGALLQPFVTNKASRRPHEAQKLFTGYRDELPVAHFAQQWATWCLVQAMKDILDKVHCETKFLPQSHRATEPQRQKEREEVSENESSDPAFQEFRAEISTRHLITQCIEPLHILSFTLPLSLCLCVSVASYSFQAIYANLDSAAANNLPNSAILCGSGIRDSAAA